MPCLCLTKKRYGGLAYVGTLSDAGRMGQRSNFRATTTADLGWFLGDSCLGFMVGHHVWLIIPNDEEFTLQKVVIPN